MLERHISYKLLNDMNLNEVINIICIFLLRSSMANLLWLSGKPQEPRKCGNDLPAALCKY